MTYLKQLQKEIAEWAGYNFPQRSVHGRLIGAGEKLGELAEELLELVVPALHMMRQLGRVNRGFLKREDGIRGTPEFHEGKMRDAIADITFFLIDFCTLNGWDYQEVLEEIWSEVQKRDWIDDPLYGLKRYRGQNE